MPFVFPLCLHHPRSSSATRISAHQDSISQDHNRRYVFYMNCNIHKTQLQDFIYVGSSLLCYSGKSQSCNNSLTVDVQWNTTKLCTPPFVDTSMQWEEYLVQVVFCCRCMTTQLKTLGNLYWSIASQCKFQRIVQLTRPLKPRSLEFLQRTCKNVLFGLLLGTVHTGYNCNVSIGVGIVQY